MRKKGIYAIILIISVVGAVFIGYLYNTAVSFEEFSFKDLFRYLTDGRLTFIEDDIIREYEGNEHSEFLISDNLLYKSGKNGTEVINRKGEIEAALDIGLYEAVITDYDDKVFIGDRKGTAVYIIENNEILKQIELPGYIHNITFNERGFGIITGVDRNEVSYAYVIDRNGDIIFKRYLTEMYAAGAVVSEDNSEIILNCIDTTGTEAKTELQFLDISGKETGAVKPGLDCLYPIIRYTGEDSFYIAGMKGILYFEDREIKWEYDFRHLVNAIKLSDREIAVLNMKSGNTGEILIFDFKGNVKEKIDIDKAAVNIFTYSGILAVNLGNEVIFMNKKGEEIGAFSSIHDIKDVLFFNKIEAVIITERNYVLRKFANKH